MNHNYREMLDITVLSSDEIDEVGGGPLFLAPLAALTFPQAAAVVTAFAAGVAGGWTFGSQVFAP